MIRRQVSGFSGLLEVEIPNRAVVKAATPVLVLDLGFGDVVALHAFRVNTRFTHLSIRLLTTQ